MVTYTGQQLEQMNGWWIRETRTQWPSLTLLLNQERGMTPEVTRNPNNLTPTPTSPDRMTPTPTQEDSTSSTMTNQDYKVIWDSLTKQEVTSLRTSMSRKLRRLKYSPNTTGEPCHHCNRNNCPYFRDLNNLSSPIQTGLLLNRIKYHHPLYSCPSLRICPQEHNLIHRILYHHPLYSPMHLLVIRIFLAAKFQLGDFHIPCKYKWVGLDIPYLRKIHRTPSTRQKLRRIQWLDQLLPEKHFLQLASKHLTLLKDNTKMLQLWLGSLEPPHRRLARKLDLTLLETSQGTPWPNNCHLWPVHQLNHLCHELVPEKIWKTPLALHIQQQVLDRLNNSRKRKREEMNASTSSSKRAKRT